ncbi:MAG: 2-oxoglutarate ferredoxin oxidoreductase subuit alpha [Deltaproteobacteria bacterium]|nr:2-oxoglutarate ferredoxin oxidoreductase subuit alpha [Deltaproteobacteria bacterium]
MDYSIKIGGEAGQGIQTIGDALASVFARSGYHVFTDQDYESRIRGGHNFYRIRLSDVPVRAPKKQLDILIALDKASVTLHQPEMREEGTIIYDSALLKESFDGPQFLDIPFIKLATDTGASKIVANTVATGAVLGMLGFPLEPLFGILDIILRKKDDQTRQQNRLSAIAGRDYAARNCKRCSFTLRSAGLPKMLLPGSDAIGFGALAGGCQFYSAYPMTPSTGIMTYIGGKAKDYGVVVEQAEDEIAAINMALGASYAGVRSMTGTSGGGFALMVEGLSLAAMTETPIVIALAQRPGPATGLPTRTEQADLFFALYAGHGEFPRIIFAPGDPEQAIRLTAKAFDLAQKYQVPAIVMTDQYLADTQWTFDNISLNDLPMRDYRANTEEIEGLDEYRRHAFTETGISPFAIPGKTKHVVVTDSDEHTEAGHLVEDAQIRREMVEKRLFRKIESIKREIEPPVYFGPENAATVLVSWGSTYGIVREAAEKLADKRVGMLHFSEIYPFPGREKFDYSGLLNRAERRICIENNVTSQFAQLLEAQTGCTITDRITRYDGRPYLVEELLEELRGRT